MIPFAWQLWRDKKGRLSWLRIGTLALLLVPVAKALYDIDDIVHGARPINDLIHRAGFWALIFLGVTLAVTPFRRIARYGNLVDVRRMLGVGCFCYIAVHLALYVTDQSYDLGKVAYEITHRVYLIIGGFAWLGLAVLAVTSTDGMMRRLGGQRWRRLHQIIYAIALLALIHYFQQTKADVTVPTFAASLFGWLIGYRLLAWWLDTSELSSLSLLGLTVVVSALTFAGEAIGIALAFHVSPMRVLSVAFNINAGIRPGWEVLAAGLAVVALDAVRARWNGRSARRPRAVAAE
jgi:sulfoxide reductase heme-binding subunit YedZ